MKVLDLQCAQHHVFEGWFGSEDDYQSQLTRGLLNCPMCGDASVSKKLSAPRFNLNATEASTNAAPPLPSLQDAANLEPAQLQAALLKMVRHVVANTEDVGTQFSEEARKMHYGETEARNIRGQTSVREAVELLEEGIEVMPLPMLPALKETLQ